MKEHREIRKQISGPEAAPYMGFARKLLGEMKQQMQLGELKQLKWTKLLKDGTQIIVQSVFGQDKVTILVPVGFSKAGGKKKRKYKRQDEVIFGHDNVMFRWTQTEGKVYIDNPAGVTNTRCYAVSKDGLAVAVRQQSSAGIIGKYWAQDEGFVDIGLGPASTANGISADGLVISGIMNTSKAFIWTKDTGAVDVGTAGSYLTSLVCLSDDGETAAWSDSSEVAYRWTKKGGTDTIGNFVVRGISGDGTTIVGYKAVGSFEQPLKFTDATGEQVLPLPATVGIVYGGQAQGVSQDGGVVAGMYYYDDFGLGGSHDHLAMWDAEGPHALGALYTNPLANNRNDMMGTDVSPDGSVIVGIGLSGANFIGFDSFRWTAASGFQQFGTGPDGGMTVIAVPESEYEREFDE